MQKKKVFSMSKLSADVKAGVITLAIISGFLMLAGIISLITSNSFLSSSLDALLYSMVIGAVYLVVLTAIDS